MNESEQQNQPDEVPGDEQLDVEGPNESTQPSGAPDLGDDDADEQSEAEGEA